MAKKTKKAIIKNTAVEEGGILKRGVGVFLSEADVINSNYSEFFWEEYFDVASEKWEPVKTVGHASCLLNSIVRLQELGYRIQLHSSILRGDGR